MGFLSAFRFAASVTRSGGQTSAPTSSRSGVASPWSPSTLTKIAWSDVLGLEADVVTRAEAMTVPSIVKGRSLIVGPLSRHPLAAYRGAQKITTPAWLSRTSTDVSPQMRMLWTLDDLIFGGWSLWAVERGASGQIVDAVRVPPEWWTVTQDLTVEVNGRPVTSEEVVLFQGPQDGLLECGKGTIRAAVAMERAWATRVSTPAPLVELHGTDAQMPLDEAEVQELVDAWETARSSGGATAYTPASIEAKIHTGSDASLFVEGRNAIRLDVANFLALPGELLDGSTATASLTYSTQEGTRNEFVDYSLAYWAGPIEARLSQDDVTPRGTRIGFDLSDFLTTTPAPSGPARED